MLRVAEVNVSVSEVKILLVKVSNEVKSYWSKGYCYV